MLMTHDQARMTWCPLMRYANGMQSTNCAVNIDADQPPGCQGRFCAMWRWGEDEKAFKMFVCEDVQANVEPTRPEHVPASYAFEPHDPAEGQPAAWVEPDADRQARRRGYCGLAGMPWGAHRP